MTKPKFKIGDVAWYYFYDKKEKEDVCASVTIGAAVLLGKRWTYRVSMGDGGARPDMREENLYKNFEDIPFKKEAEIKTGK